MSLLEGTSVSPGFASGIATVYDYEIERRLETPHRSITSSEVESECERLDGAWDRSGQELKLLELAAKNQPNLVESVAVLSAHSVMAGEIGAVVRQHIGRELVNVEQALDAVVADLVGRLQNLDDEYLGEREQDVRDVGRRMMRQLAGGPSTSVGDRLPPGSVIVVRELFPSEAVELAKSGVVAVVCERGGKNSHTATVARSMGIPAITAIHDATSEIKAGVRLLVDGKSGTVIASPTSVDEQCFAERLCEYNFDASTALAANGDQPCVTQDGVVIELVANVVGPDEVAQVDEHNLGGVGLFRTEFLFLESAERPDFQTQADLYGEMAGGLDGLPIVIRTFDLGGDKLPTFLEREQLTAHASLHLRGLRFSLTEGSILATQLRAIAHVAQTHDVRILFPMVVGIDDLSRAAAALEKIVHELDVPVRPAIGAMIETPAALFALDEICELADFVAIGTDDLAQYMLAADRDLSKGTDDCTAMHPAVLRAIRQVVEAADARDCPVCVCGEEAGDADFACLLVGLGVRELSVSPSHAVAVRQALRKIDSSAARRIAEQALRCRTPQQVRDLLLQLNSTGAQAKPLAANSRQNGAAIDRAVIQQRPVPRNGHQRTETAVVYCEANFGDVDGKTANGLVRHSEKYKILAVIDSEKAGLDSGTVLDDEPNSIPICHDLADALTHSLEIPDYYIFGMAPASGMLSIHERGLVLDAIGHGMNIVNGLHEFLNDDPEFAAASAAAKVRILDVRKPRPKKDLHMFSGRIAAVTCPRIAVLGTDCAIGKRTTATVLTRALNESGLKAVMVGTGQTGLIQGARYGVSLDAVPSQFCAGELEATIIAAFEGEKPDVIIIEGQGALSHPAFSTSSFILRGSCPHGVVLQHAPRRFSRCDFPHMAMPTPADEIRLIENFSDTRVIGLTLNHENMTHDEVSQAITKYEVELGIPATDALTQSPERLVEMVLSAFPQLNQQPIVCAG